MENDLGTSTTGRKAILPFGYFPDIASALPGLGGARAPVDPRYCFHSAYAFYLPGRVLFKVQFNGVCASYGEITIRAHAFRPGGGADVSLASSVQRNLENLKDSSMCLELSVIALPGVQYALYAFLSAPSDLTAGGIVIEADELGGEVAENFSDSAEEPSAFGSKLRPALPQLIDAAPPSLEAPVSQGCTVAQLDSTTFQRWAVAFCNAFDAEMTPDLWRHVHALEFLERAEFLQAGARGLLVGQFQHMTGSLIARGCEVISISADAQGNLEVPKPLDALDEFSSLNAKCDFAIVSKTVMAQIPDARDLFNAVNRCLFRGGASLLWLDYDIKPQGDSRLSAGHVSRAEVLRLALHALGHGSRVLRLKLPRADDLLEEHEAVPFTFVSIR